MIKNMFLAIILILSTPLSLLGMKKGKVKTNKEQARAANQARREKAEEQRIIRQKQAEKKVAQEALEKKKQEEEHQKFLASLPEMFRQAEELRSREVADEKRIEQELSSIESEDKASLAFSQQFRIEDKEKTNKDSKQNVQPVIVEAQQMDKRPSLPVAGSASAHVTTSDNKKSDEKQMGIMTPAVQKAVEQPAKTDAKLVSAQRKLNKKAVEFVPLQTTLDVTSELSDEEIYKAHKQDLAARKRNGQPKDGYFVACDERDWNTYSEILTATMYKTWVQKHHQVQKNIQKQIIDAAQPYLSYLAKYSKITPTSEYQRRALYDMLLHRELKVKELANKAIIPCQTCVRLKLLKNPSKVIRDQLLEAIPTQHYVFEGKIMEKQSRIEIYLEDRNHFRYNSLKGRIQQRKEEAKLPAAKRRLLRSAFTRWKDSMPRLATLAEVNEQDEQYVTSDLN